jgi:hypothetical protein
MLHVNALLSSLHHRLGTGRHRIRIWAITVLAVAALVPQARASQLLATIDESSALPRLILGGDALRTTYLFYGDNWAWAAQNIDTRQLQGFEGRFTGSNELLATTLSGSLTAPGPQSLRWQWAFQASKAMKGGMGGGMEFVFDLVAYRALLGEPELLPGRQGWRWGRADGPRAEMRFEPPLADVFFEQGDRGRVRALFYNKEIRVGELSHTATLTLEGGAALRAPPSVRYGFNRAASWPLIKMDAPEVGLDLSFLNAQDKPAGRRGPVRAAGDRLVWPDGTPARFWGTNVTANALFSTPRDRVPGQARRMARMGINLVRMTHHDPPWTSPNIFGDGDTPGTRQILASSRDALDWWVKCLQDEGIYVWIDVHVQRHFKAADGIDHFEELPLGFGPKTRDLKGFNYVNRSIQTAMHQFADAYLGAVNPYTRKRLLDDPAVLAVQITNENDVTHHFGNLMLPNKGVPNHTALYMAAAEAFAKRHRLPKDKVWRSWEHGPSKLFLSDLEVAFHREAMQRLRGQGLRALVSTTSQWGDNPLSSIPALTVGDVIDAHVYGDGEELERNPLWQPNLVHFVAMSQVAGLPLTLSEWNMGAHPAPDRHVLPLYIAASAAHQGWDAMMQYAYSQVALHHNGVTEHWSAFNDPAQVVPFAAAALMYRQGHLREASSVYAFAPSSATMFGTALSAENTPALRLASERGKVLLVMPATPELPWLKAGSVPEGARRITDVARLDSPPAGDRIAADNGETVRDWARGVYTINTSHSQAALGWIGGQRQQLGDIEVAVSSPHASVSVHSMDGKPIAQSTQLLIAVAAVTMPAAEGVAQFRSQPVGGSVTVRAPAGLQLFELPEAGPRATPAALRFANGRYTINLGDIQGTRWLMLRAGR